MTTLSAIINDIAALQVPYASAVVPTRFAGTLVDEIEDADLPARVITVIGALSGERARALTPVGQMTVRWRVADLLLVRSVGLGRGLRDEADHLTRYVYDYARLVRALRGQRATLEAWEAEIGVIAYPTGTDRMYEGVRCTLTIAHIITED